MITPLKSYSFQFASDGTSTSLILDMSTLPLGVDFTGVTAVGILGPLLAAAVQGPSVAASVSGTIATFNFAYAPQRTDANGNILIYTLTFFLQLVPTAAQFAQSNGTVGYGNGGYGLNGYGQ